VIVIWLCTQVRRKAEPEGRCIPCCSSSGCRRLKWFAQLPRLARRDALERVFNGLGARNAYRSCRVCRWRVRKDVQYSNGLDKPWAPGRRVYPSAVAATISGVDIRWSHNAECNAPPTRPCDTRFGAFHTSFRTFASLRLCVRFFFFRAGRLPTTTGSHP